MAEERFIPNDFSPLLTLPRTPADLLQQAAEEIIKECPPQDSYTKEAPLHGLFIGPTGLAYFFLHLSVSHPKLRIGNESPLHWARAYINGKRPDDRLQPGACGLVSERLSHEAVTACITKDLGHVRTFVSSLTPIIAPKIEGQDDPYPTETVYGRTGALYMLRMVRHFVPNSAAVLERAIVLLTERIMATDDDGEGNWRYRGKRYLGAAHGDLGTITQLVLTSPPIASSLVGRMEQLLDYQLPDGNWAKCVGDEAADLAQWCHGAPGFILCLLSLRPFFPTLHSKIDAAIEKGRACTWEKGLLKKEPNLCHGILSNAFALELGPRREHFLALATPEKMAEMREADPSLFERASYGVNNSIMMNYWQSAAWTWAVCEKEMPRLILCNDI